MALKYGIVAHLLPETYKRMVSAWLEEDCPGFDYSGFVVGETTAEAKLLGKSAVSVDLLHFLNSRSSVLALDARGGGGRGGEGGGGLW